MVAFTAYEATFTGGTYIAAADLTGDGRSEVFTGAAEDGGPRVRVYDGPSLTADQTQVFLADFVAIEDEDFRDGVRPATSTGDGVSDLVLGAGPGDRPRVRALDGKATHAASPGYTVQSSESRSAGRIVPTEAAVAAKG